MSRASAERKTDVEAAAPHQVGEVRARLLLAALVNEVEPSPPPFLHIAKGGRVFIRPAVGVEDPLRDFKPSHRPLTLLVIGAVEPKISMRGLDTVYSPLPDRRQTGGKRVRRHKLKYSLAVLSARDKPASIARHHRIRGKPIGGEKLCRH